MPSSALFRKLSARSGARRAARNSTDCPAGICHVIRCRSRNGESVADLSLERFLGAGQLRGSELRLDDLYRTILALDDKIRNGFGGTAAYPCQLWNFPCCCLCRNDLFASESDSGTRGPLPKLPLGTIRQSAHERPSRSCTAKLTRRTKRARHSDLSQAHIRHRLT